MSVLFWYESVSSEEETFLTSTWKPNHESYVAAWALCSGEAEEFFVQHQLKSLCSPICSSWSQSWLEIVCTDISKEWFEQVYLKIWLSRTGDQYLCILAHHRPPHFFGISFSGVSYRRPWPRKNISRVLNMKFYLCWKNVYLSIVELFDFCLRYIFNCIPIPFIFPYGSGFFSCLSESHKLHILLKKA